MRSYASKTSPSARLIAINYVLTLSSESLASSSASSTPLMLRFGSMPDPFDSLYTAIPVRHAVAWNSSIYTFFTVNPVLFQKLVEALRYHNFNSASTFAFLFAFRNQVFAEFTAKLLYINSSISSGQNCRRIIVKYCLFSSRSHGQQFHRQRAPFP